MIGIKILWECPVCGNTTKTDNPFWNNKFPKNMIKPERCGCGNTKYKLKDIERCEYEIKVKNE